MDKKKVLTFGILAALLVCCLAGLVSAGGEGAVVVTLTSPSTEIKDTQLFRVTVPVTHMQNISNVTFYVGTTQVCSNQSDELEAGLNNTGISFNCSVASNTLGLVDTATYTVTARIYNSTNVEIGTAASTTGVAVDNTVPTCGVVSSHIKTNREYKFPVWVKATVYNASGCTFSINNKAFVGTVNGSVGTEECHYTLVTADLPAGTYTVTAISTDSSATANSTSCANIPYVSFGKESSAVRGAVIDADFAGEDFEGEGVGNGTKVLVLVAVCALVYWLVKKK